MKEIKDFLNSPDEPESKMCVLKKVVSVKEIAEIDYIKNMIPSIYHSLALKIYELGGTDDLLNEVCKKFYRPGYEIYIEGGVSAWVPYELFEKTFKILEPSEVIELAQEGSISVNTSCDLFLKIKGDMDIVDAYNNERNN